MTGFLKGVATALITPFTENGIDFDALSRILRRQKESGADAVVICGTTGEPSTMTQSEKDAVIAFARKETVGMKLIVGTGGNNTATAIAATKRAAELGADGVLAVTPYYNKCTQNGLIAYYTALCGATDLPVIAYNVPARTGVNILPATMAKIAEIPNMAGIKEASGNMAQVMETARLIRGKCDLYSGEDALNLPILCIGGRAVISVVSNLVPADVKKLVDLVGRGELSEAIALSDALLPLIDACFSEVNPIPVKEGMRLLGFGTGTLRPPLTPMEPQNRERLIAAMRAYGLEVRA